MAVTRLVQGQHRDQRKIGKYSSAGNAAMQHPILNYRGHEAVQFADADGANFASQNHALQRSRMNSKKRCGLIAVEQRIGSDSKGWFLRPWRFPEVCHFSSSLLHESF